ncbi:DNA-binding transcriptional regulator, XRE family [Treponema berlinense]|uniref:DNA-binding transcriptional regulator, XRE family n=2 Tax=Treponema berlinense TaxID=225004 RepID=A0A1T4QQ64_9SPIR|nr:DNA-binding transcriptional regulator, XRE family [Treponema berlinense]
MLSLNLKFQNCEIVIFFNKNYNLYDIIISMDVDYKKLWIRLIDRGIKNKTELIPLAGISTNILAKLSKGEFISMESLKKICIALDCDIGDIVSFRENK